MREIVGKATDSVDRKEEDKEAVLITGSKDRVSVSRRGRRLGSKGGVGAQKGQSRDVKALSPLSCALSNHVKILNSVRTQRAVRQPFRLMAQRAVRQPFRLMVQRAVRQSFRLMVQWL